jgi:antitoxin component YwqK of YwqJK toxin-antitoxin module
MKNNLILLLFVILSFSGKAQIYNEKDSTYYVDSNFKEKYSGVYIHYFPNTSVVECKLTLEKGKNEGECIVYHQNGQIFRKGIYVNGKWHGDLSEFHPNGQLAKKVTYTNGIPNGELYIYHESGYLQGKTYYINGELQGNWYQYHPNGSIMGQGQYHQGKIHGETIWYDPNGKVSNFYAIPLKW